MRRSNVAYTSKLHIIYIRLLSAWINVDQFNTNNTKFVQYMCLARQWNVLITKLSSKFIVIVIRYLLWPATRTEHKHHCSHITQYIKQACILGQRIYEGTLRYVTLGTRLAKIRLKVQREIMDVRCARLRCYIRAWRRSDLLACRNYTVEKRASVTSTRLEILTIRLREHMPLGILYLGK